jgi:hypothetical protein
MESNGKSVLTTGPERYCPISGLHAPRRSHGAVGLKSATPPTRLLPHGRHQPESPRLHWNGVSNPAPVSVTATHVAMPNAAIAIDVKRRPDIEHHSRIETVSGSKMAAGESLALTADAMANSMSNSAPKPYAMRTSRAARSASAAPVPSPIPFMATLAANTAVYIVRRRSSMAPEL